MGNELSESERIEAINIMAQNMFDRAKYYGSGVGQIGGDKTILAEVALNALLKSFNITKK
jgi:hypothetical protein